MPPRLGLEEDDDEEMPWEAQARVADKKKAAKGCKKPAAPSKQPGIKESLLASSAKAKVDDKVEDSDDDDDEDLLGGNFTKHKMEAKGPKLTSAFADNSDAKKKGDRRLLPKRKPLPSVAKELKKHKDWSAACYLYEKDNKEQWVFSHPILGEFKHNDLHKSLAEIQKRESKAAAGGSSRRLSTGSTSAAGEAEQDVDEEEAEAAAAGEGRRSSLGGGGSSSGGDDLAALLGNKRRREEEEQQMKERVRDELEQQMDTGIRVNPLLAKMYSGK